MARTKTNDVNSISINKLKEWNYLCGGYRSGAIIWTRGDSKSSVGITVTGEPPYLFLNLQYIHTSRYTEETTNCNYDIQIMSTPCNFGGVRYWFICPLVCTGQPCRRRVGVLYCGSKFFGCRHCYHLTYQSQYKYRGVMAVLFSIMDVGDKVRELDDQITTRYYAGKPTRKQRKLDKLYDKAYFYNSLARSKKMI